MAISAHVPGSKSMTQRALVIGALSQQQTVIEGAVGCDDSERLSGVLVSLGAGVRWDGDTVRVAPRPMRASGQTLQCGNAGTALRFASCLCLVAPGRMTLDGDARMRHRPVRPLGLALARLGAQVTYPGQEGFPPVTLEGPCQAAPEVTLDAQASSQFASGLMLVAPRLPRGLVLRLQGAVVSAPYLEMTKRMMAVAGARVSQPQPNVFHVEPGPYFAGPGPAAFLIEPDWSSAAFLLAAGFVSRRDVVVCGLPPAPSSCQGDAAFEAMLAELRTRRAPHDFDLGACPDLIAPLAAAAIFASHPTCIRNVAHARLKESDRIAVLASELRKAGADLDELEDGLAVRPGLQAREQPVTLDPHADHRMAMAFGVVSLRAPWIRVSNPGCVTKSFPSFWAELNRLPSGGA